MIIRTPEEETALREGGQHLGRILQRLARIAEAGMRTDELDQAAREMIAEVDGQPAFLGYRPDGAPRAFPAALCISINEEIVHGISNEKPRTLAEGDIISLDLGLVHNGFITDAAVVVIVGEGDDEARRLKSAAEEALAAAVQAAKTGNTTGHIGEAVEAVGEKYGFHVPHELGGHGVGKTVHEEPFVPNFGRGGSGAELKTGMVLAIEPMFIVGTGRIRSGGDGYTLSSADGSLTVQIEHTVIVTPQGGDIITKA